MAGRGGVGSSFGQRIATRMVGVVALTLLIASSLYGRTGREAADIELARLSYTQAVRVAGEAERSLTAQGVPTRVTTDYLHRASYDLDASLVLFLEADTPLAVAHGPSLTRALGRLRRSEDARGRFTDTGHTPWVPEFGDPPNPERFPRRNGRLARVQMTWPYAIEMPVGANMTLQLVPLSLLPLKDGGYRSGLFVLFILMALVALLMALRLARPLESAAIAIERMASTGGDWGLYQSSLKEIGWIARAATRLRERAVDAETQQREVLRSLTRILIEPMGRVQEGLSTISGARLSTARRDALAEVEREVSTLHRTINALWQWNCLEAGALDATLEDNDLRRILREVVRLFQERRAPDLEVRIHVAKDVDQTVQSDARLFAAVLAAVLDNAHLHGQGPVDIQVNRAHTKVEIIVRDRGEGVPFEELGMLFQPFRRGSGETAGLGLSLRISRLVMALHEGGLSARNHPQGGFEIALWLPAPPVRVSEVDKSLQHVGWARNLGQNRLEPVQGAESIRDEPENETQDQAETPPKEVATTEPPPPPDDSLEYELEP